MFGNWIVNYLIGKLKVCERYPNIINPSSSFIEANLAILPPLPGERCVLMFHLTCSSKETWKFTAQECRDWASIEATPKPIISNKDSRKRISRRKFSAIDISISFPSTSAFQFLEFDLCVTQSRRVGHDEDRWLNHRNFSTEFNTESFLPLRTFELGFRTLVSSYKKN